MSSRKQAGAGATGKWLAIVGIGEDGLAGLGAAAQQAIGEAEFVFGGRRHLDLAAPAIRGEARAWPSPFDAGMNMVLALRGRRVCVLASGDPFHHGVGATLARHVDASELLVYPAPSAFSLAAARLGWALQDIEVISLHGRPLSPLRPLLQPQVRIVALTGDGAAPTAIAQLLTENGFGGSRLHVLERLGGPNEHLSWFRADEVGGQLFDPLNVVAIEVAAAGDAPVLPFANALADDLFEHDGQITKREIRAITLSSLAPRRGALLWDIGAGSGSISISWMLTHPSMRAIAIEADAERVARIRRNADRLGAPGLVIVEGPAPQALAELPMPDAIFIGGGGAEPGVTDRAIESLRSGGRLVANAVTTKMEAVLLSLHARLGGDIVRIAITRAAPIGEATGWRPAMPVTQWIWTRP
ncbi:MAG: precorrin-6y C5,15-methyltransferase (decarboxylating) subunit CbiE [Dongiaceae bacterium]